MTAVPRLRGTGLLLLGLLALAACSPVRSDSGGGSTFLARQYLERGRAAWAAGNEPNARFLVGRAVELAPRDPNALAFWQARWPVDSLPPAARQALAAADGAAGGAVAAAGVAASPPGDAGSAEATAALADTSEPSAEPVLPDVSTEPLSPLDGSPRAAAAEPPPEPAVPGEELVRRRAAFERARTSSARGELLRAGRDLLEAWPQHLPDVHRVLSAWVESGIEPGATEARVRDLLASLEFGDASFLAGKPADVGDAEFLRVWRGRFLDLLGWAAFQRGDLAQAEAALRSGENEINLRGRGDVSHLRHLAAFYERRGDLRRAEQYAIAAAARDASESGEIRALAARLWARRHRGTAGLQDRLALEAERVRREERSAAIAGRLYAPVPAFSARRADGGVLTERSLRGRVTVLVLWEPGCEDCLRLLRDLSQRSAAAAGTASRRAPVERLALEVGGEAAPAQGGLGPLPGVALATLERPGPLRRALAAERLPLTLVVEPAGFIQYRHAGYPEETAARAGWLERLRWQVEGLSALARGSGAAPGRAPAARTGAAGSGRSR
ncbi:MAG: TlpA family protein disulfide reductase [Gemmatimonadota bacterium]